MGNTCVGPCNAKRHGFFQSISAALWRTRSPGGPEALPPATSTGIAAVAAPDKPPGPVKIPDEDLKKLAVAPAPASEEPPPQSSRHKKPTHIKRVSSIGLQIDSVLQRRTAKLKDLYSLGRKLGQGQFGTTYLCVEKATGKEHACKSIAKRKLVTEEDVEDVRREIQIMHHLAGHPNVISIVGPYEDAVAVHVVMELCSGGELFDRIIQRRHYSEKAAAELAKGSSVSWKHAIHCGLCTGISSPTTSFSSIRKRSRHLRRSTLGCLYSLSQVLL